MKKLILGLSTMLVMLASTSCGDGKSMVTPISSGRPYEVLVVADDKCWMSPDSALFHVLDTDVPGLPQSERSFRISRVRPEYFERAMRIFRNIIIVDIQPSVYTQTKFKYTRDAYSSPQMIMTIQSSSQEDFADYVSKHGNVIVDFFTRAEMNRQIKLLEKEHSSLVSARVGSQFDCDIWMPEDLTSYKTGQDFLWASNNLNDLNFVMYSYPFRDNRTFTKEFFIHKRDSVMAINIPGAREGMYMETADSSLVSVKNIAVQGDYAFEVRGLWEMKNDAMGGPFVSHVRVDRANARVIVVEGFVYNPSKLKRDPMRKLEAALYTLKLPQEKGKGLSELPVDQSVSEEKAVKEAEQQK